MLRNFCPPEASQNFQNDRQKLNILPLFPYIGSIWRYGGRSSFRIINRLMQIAQLHDGTVFNAMTWQH